MKNRHLERLQQVMREYHRHHPWRLNGGLFIPHAYPPTEALSWWDDVGFIHGGRRVMVWWVHPRMKYADAIEARAYEIAGPTPAEFPEEQSVRSKRQFRPVKPYDFEFSNRLTEYHEKVNAIEDKLRSEGIEHEVFPSLSIKRHPRCTDMYLCASVEIHTVDDIRNLARIAKQLIKREIPLSDVFPSRGYSKKDWLQEKHLRTPYLFGNG